IQRAWHRIGNRIRKAIQPVPNAYEDAAQTIGGRKTHGDKSDGVYRKARPPATHSATLYSRSVFKKQDRQRAPVLFCLLSSVSCLLLFAPNSNIGCASKTRGDLPIELCRRTHSGSALQ